MCRSLAAANIKAELPSGKQPTTFVRLRISRITRSSILFVRIRSQGNFCLKRSAVITPFVFHKFVS
jgi:hypothetical protein